MLVHPLHLMISGVWCVITLVYANIFIQDNTNAILHINGALLVIRELSHYCNDLAKNLQFGRKKYTGT